MPSVAQRSFTGGEIAPSLYARTDLQKYTQGLRQCRNFVVQRHGGAANRSGTQFIGEVKTSSSVVRLIPFKFDDQIANTYLLEFGPNYIRFFQAAARINVGTVAAWADVTAYLVGDLVSQGGVNYYCTLAHTSAAALDQPGTGSNWQIKWAALAGTIYEIPSPYAAVDLANLVFAQSGDVITLTHPNYAPMELRRYGATRWILSTPSFGPSLAPPGNLAKTGGTVTAWVDATAYVVGDVRSNGGANYQCAFSHTASAALNAPGTGTNWQSYWFATLSRYWVITAVKETTFEESLVSAVIAGAAANFPNRPSPVVLTWDAVPGALYYNVYRSVDGNAFGFVTSSASTTVLVSDNTWTTTSSVASTTTAGLWMQALTQCRNPLTITAPTKPYDGKFNVFFKIAVTGPGSGYYTLGRVRAFYSRDGEARVDAGLVNSNTYAVGSSGTATYTGTGSISVPDNGYAALTIDLVPEVYGGGGIATFSATLDETLAGFDKIEWNKTVPGYTDDGTIAQQYALRPPTQPSVLNAATKWPSTVGYYQQRQLFGNTIAEPEKVFASRIASFRSFAGSLPVLADDAVLFTLAGSQVNAIRHFIDIGRLIVFTAQSEMMVEGDQTGLLKPDAVNMRQVSANGCSRLRPIKVNTTALYVQARQSIVRDLQPVTQQSYEGTDLTVFAAHLFRGFTLVDWDFALNPDGVVWAVRNDGTLLGLTYLRDHQIWGWHRHDTDGSFENVCVLPENSEDAVYFVVRRTINGVTKRFIERLVSRTFTLIQDAHFLDCATVIDGRNTSTTTMTISGGVKWTYDETLVMTSSLAYFSAADVGNSIFLPAADGTQLEFKLEVYTSTTVMSGHAVKTVPADLRAAAKTVWSKGIITVTGLTQLEAKRVAVFADGYVVCSPNNTKSPGVALTVVGGQIVLERPYVQIKVGLPIIADLETLDLDSSGAASIKDRSTIIGKVILFVERSRGIWIGKASAPTVADPIHGMQELKLRTSESYASPISLITDNIEVNMESSWDKNGRVMIRQVDPVPLTVLSIMPTGYIPT